MAAAHDTLSVRHYGASPGSHSHDHCQILIGLDGTLDLEVEGRSGRVNAGDGRVIAPGDRHDFQSSRGARCLVLDSTDAAWMRLAAVAPRSGLGTLALYLAQACNAALPLAVASGPALLLEAWTPTTPAPRTRRAIDWMRLQAWARSRLDTPLSVADLAAQAHLSEAQFSERCRSELHSSPMAWLRGLRLQRAQQLRAQGLPVAEAALRCGYRSPSALTAALRRLPTPTPPDRDD